MQSQLGEDRVAQQGHWKGILAEALERNRRLKKTSETTLPLLPSVLG